MSCHTIDEEDKREKLTQDERDELKQSVLSRDANTGEGNNGGDSSSRGESGQGSQVKLGPEIHEVYCQLTMKDVEEVEEA